VSGSLVAVLFVLVVAGLVWAKVGGARRRTGRRTDALTRLAPLVSGTVSRDDQRLRGTYRGHAIEAWTSKYDPTPVNSNQPSSPGVNVLHLRLGDVPGRAPWSCRSWPRLNPFGERPYRFNWTSGFVAELSARMAQVAGLPAPDPALEERLRAAGVVEAIEALGRESSGFLPHVRYSPQGWEADGVLCEVEMRRNTDPSPERFQELLDQAVRIAEINVAANSGER